MLPPLQPEHKFSLTAAEATWLLDNRATMYQLWMHIRDTLESNRLSPPAQLARMSDAELLDCAIRSPLFLQENASTDRESLMRLLRCHSAERLRAVYNDGRTLVEFIQWPAVYEAGPIELWRFVHEADEAAHAAVRALRLGIIAGRRCK